MAKNSVAEWDLSPSNNTDIAGIGILGTSPVNNFDNAFRTLMAQEAKVYDEGLQGAGNYGAFGASSDTTFAAAKATGKTLFVGAGSYAPTLSVIGPYLIAPNAVFTDFAKLKGGKQWTDFDGAGQASIWRFRDRLMVGRAAELSGTRLGDPQTSLFPNAASGAGYLPRDAQFASIHDRGGFAVVGVSRSSDTGTFPAGQTPSTGALAGFTIIDRSLSSGRAAYLECQHETGVNYSYGAEIVMKNKDANYTSTPYSGAKGTYGIYAVAGGDPSYGGVPVAPSNTAMFIWGGKFEDSQPNFKWNKGIVFGRYALTGSNGTGISGQRSGIALEMAAGHQIQWLSPVGFGAAIRSDVNVAGQDTSLVFSNNVISFKGAGGGDTIVDMVHATGAENNIQLRNAIAGAPPRVQASGSDTNIDLWLLPQNGGVLRFGVVTAQGDQAISGYITIRDNNGTVRKLAVIS